MKSIRKNSNYFMLTLISPVHIGCDEAYEPMGFSVDKTSGELNVFEPFEYISSLTEEEREKFLEICRKGTTESLLEIYRFIHLHPPGQGRIVETCPGFPDHHQKVLGLKKEKIQRELNKFEIHRTAYNTTDQTPYIPGSSIKGALKTGYLNKLADEGPDYDQLIQQLKQKAKRDKRKNFNPEKTLIEKLLKLEGLFTPEKISKDPFRLVKISDFMPVDQSFTKIMYAVNKKKKPTDKNSRGIPEIMEVVQPSTRFIGEIKTIMPQTSDEVSFRIDLEELLEANHGFYKREFDRENNELKTIGLSGPQSPGNEDALILRIGRHSGAESVTLKRYRNIKIMQGPGKKPRFLDHTTTFWLASSYSNPKNEMELIPFGWCTLTSLTEEYMVRLKTYSVLQIKSPQKKSAGSKLETASDVTSESIQTKALASFPKEPSQTPVEKLLKELELIKPNDAGRIGTVMQKMEDLEIVREKAEIAVAIRDKIGPKAFKKHKRRDYQFSN